MEQPNKWNLIESTAYGRIKVNVYKNNNSRYKLHFIKQNYYQYYKNIPNFIHSLGI